ncbi:hypothetical protein GF376_01850 [Candidatus Peregrinibacteria bacterium]|nr:hypothetical protein [Candidatus Peregrinibacteria bacterium]
MKLGDVDTRKSYVLRWSDRKKSWKLKGVLIGFLPLSNEMDSGVTVQTKKGKKIFKLNSKTQIVFGDHVKRFFDKLEEER